MVRISEETKNELKDPIGELFCDPKDLEGFVQKELKKPGRHRILTIGDVCTVALLDLGFRPHLAVFDYHTRRTDTDKKTLDLLKATYKTMTRFVNPAGTVSDIIIKEARALIDKGGAILIEGEEDLTALAFIREADEDDLVLYGQPGEGVVLVRPTKEIKRKIERWLLTPVLGHEV
jgi:GTP-dependent dephospho-CoA kinase